MNEQELFWHGEFGDAYITRNTLDNVPSAIGRWSKVLAALPTKPQSILELGCNIGINLHAFKALLPEAELHAVEINATAAKQAQESLQKAAHIHQGSLLNFSSNRQYDLSFTSGVLIHIAPEFLAKAYDTLYNNSARYICIKEYYNPVPVEIPYRGHDGKLFKRDFCADLMERFSDLRLLTYGFFYHKDPLFPAGDATWFLLEKVT